MKIDKILKIGYQGFLENDVFLYHRKSINGFLDFFKSLLRPLFHLRSKANYKLKNDTIGVALTYNQSKYLSNIISRLPNSQLVSVAVDGEPLKESRVIGGLYRFNLIWFCRGWSVLKDLNFFDRLYLLFYYHGYYIGAKDFLNKSKVKQIIVSNEVHPILRFLVLAARDLGVNTVLIPHTLPSKVFPTLIHDQVFLRGKSSLKIYRFTDYTKYHIVGDPIPATKLNNNKADNFGFCIGLAINALDDLSYILNLIAKIESLGGKVLIKLHPSFKEIPPQLKVYSEIIESNIDVFFFKIYSLICGNSAIVIDAIKQNIPVYFYSNIDDNIFYFSNYGIAPSLKDTNIEDIVNKKLYKIDKIKIKELIFDCGHNVNQRIIRILSNQMNSAFRFDNLKN